MCSNYIGEQKAEDIAKAFRAVLKGDFTFPRRRYPGYQAPVVVQRGSELQVVPMQFGMIAPWNKGEKPGKRQHNARVESVLAKPWFREAYFNRRCLVPMDGFYEWIWTSETTKWLAYFYPTKPIQLAAAGIWSAWTAPGGEVIESFSVLTREPPTFISATGHDRCPIFLPERSWSAWLAEGPRDHEELQSILQHPLQIEWAVRDDTQRDTAERKQARQARTNPAGKILLDLGLDDV